MEEELLDTTNTDPQDAALDPGPADGAVEPASEAPAPSVRESLAKAMGEPTEAIQKAENAAGRVYDKTTGRFVPKEDKPAAVAAPRAPVAQKSPEAQAGAKPAQTTPSTASAGPPTSWSPEAKAAFAAASPALQQAVAKREAEYANGIAQYRQRIESVDRVVAPYRQMFEGMPDHQALSNILTWFGHITQDPSKGIPELAQFLGFDLSTVGQAVADDGSQEFQDPRVATLMNEIAGLKTQLGSFTSERTQQRQAEISKTIADFASEKTADGKVAHPYFDRVRVDMGLLMKAAAEAGKPIDHRTAYQRAVWANDEVRAEMQAASVPVSQPAVDPTKRAVAARHAAVSPRPTGPNGASPGRAAGREQSVRESLLAAFASGG